MRRYDLKIDLFYDILIKEKRTLFEMGDKMKSYIDLGFIKIHYYSLMYIIAFFLGIFIATRE